MLHDRLGIFRAPNSDGKYIVEVMGDGIVTGRPLHTSLDLAADEAKNLLRHYNLPDNEIDSLLASAGPHVAATLVAGDFA